MIANHNKKALITHYIIVCLLGVFLLFVVFTKLYIDKQKNLAASFYPNVYIDSIPVGGKTKADVAPLFQKTDDHLKKSIITVLYKNEPVATLSAQDINLRSNAAEVLNEAYLIGRTNIASARIAQKFSTIFGLKKFHFVTGIIYDKGEIKDTLSNLEDQYNKPAKNALFTFENGRVAAFKLDEKGLKINSQKLISDLDKAVTALRRKPGNITLVLHEQVIEPEMTLAKSNNLGIEELIGAGQSDFSHSIPGRIHNVALAASKFNGIIIPKGHTFSFNDAVGDISAQTGYQQAYIIKNGRTVLGDGGGVCQVSTTLFRAALNTGLPIPERTAHAYRVGYYENDAKPGLDATVFAPGVDLKIKNDTPAAILIETSVDFDNNLLFFNLYGKKDNRKIALTEPILYDQAPPGPPKYEDDPTLPRGEVKQVDYAAWGAKASFSYKVTNNNQVTFEKQFLSVYRPWQAVYMVGIKD